MYQNMIYARMFMYVCSEETYLVHLYSFRSDCPVLIQDVCLLAQLEAKHSFVFLLLERVYNK